MSQGEKSLRKRVQDYLRTSNYRPRRRLGQNFLIEPIFWRKILEAAQPGSKDLVLEIGPGPGFLSAELARKVKRLIAIEIDPRLVDHARQVLAGLPGAEVRQGDILKISWPDIFPQRWPGGRIGRRLIISNLPYSITSPVLEKMAEGADFWDEAYLTLQKEVADRLTCRPASPDCGSLTLFANYYFELKKLFNIPAGAFYPSPEVASTAVRFKARTRPPFKIEGEPEKFFRFVQMAFSQRRKQISNSLGFALGLVFDRVKAGPILKKLGLDQRKRVEELSLKQMIGIFNQAARQ